MAPPLQYHFLTSPPCATSDCHRFPRSARQECVRSTCRLCVIRQPLLAYNASLCKWNFCRVCSMILQLGGSVSHVSMDSWPAGIVTRWDSHCRGPSARPWMNDAYQLQLHVINAGQLAYYNDAFVTFRIYTFLHLAQPLVVPFWQRTLEKCMILTSTLQAFTGRSYACVAGSVG